MNWSALKDMKCPKCGSELVDEQRGFRCSFGRGTSAQCTFFISKAKFDQVITSLYKPRERSTETMSADERLSELNNYGRTPLYERGDNE
jgi:hypothetical protein